MSGLTGKGFSMDISPTCRAQDPKNFSTEDTNKENKTASCPVLSLVHFSRAPFLSFESVKLGYTKTAVLEIENPNEDVTEVTIDKFPSAKGFSVEKKSFILQPKERTLLSITWTPVEEGGIRELVVFTANGIVKHQAILLGRAEAPKKKKRSLWESMKRRKPSEKSASFKTKKNEAVQPKAANKTFHVSRKVEYTKTEWVRGPLQSCANVTVTEDKTPKDRSKFKGISLSPIGVAQQQTYTPGSLRRSTTYSVLDKLESDDSLQEEKPVVQTILYPDETEDIEYMSKHTFCKSTTVSEYMKTNIVRILNRTHSPVSTPDRVIVPLTPLSQNRMLSPDSFLNNSYVPNGDHELSSVSSILSPDQFLKDALEAVQPCVTKTCQESVKSPLDASSLDSSASPDSLNETDDGTHFQYTASAVDNAHLPEVSFEDLEPTKTRLTFFVKSKPDDIQIKEVKNDIQSPDEPKNLPVISATIVKSKSYFVRESKPEPKRETYRRRLLEPESEVPVKTSLSRPKVVAFQSLPVIDSVVSLEAQSSEDTVSSPITTNPVLQSRKRKGEEFLEHKCDQKDQRLEGSKRNKAIRPVVEIKKPTNARRNTTRSLNGTEQRLQKKRMVSLALKSSAMPSVKTSKPVGVPQSQLIFSKPVKTGSLSLKSNGTASLKMAKSAVVGVAQSQLTFVKPVQTVIPRHPLPFAAKNMFYDERWIEKEEQGFTWWINYILTPDDFKVNTEVSKVNAVSLVCGAEHQNRINVPKAPTKEEMSFKTYTANCRLNRLRRAACRLFASEDMVKAIRRLELEIEARRLLVRKDRHLWKDIGERQKVLNWLLSYNPLWLRIGLETIFGELVSLESNSDIMGLAMFVLSRLLWNPDIAAEYRHPKVPHLYRDGHEEALSRFTLKKLLLLVCFLDRAKESRIIEHDPCLFCLDSEFKTTKDLLLAFSRDFLSGEGILSRHLSYMGLAVSHAQTPLDEFNFAVRNLATDLRCGVRLVRIMELFTQNWSLSSKLRVPAISRLQKMHNVEVALQVLRARGVELNDEHGAKIDSRDIVDGHREKTLALLWRIIFTFQVEILLDEEQLREEISFLKRTWATHQKLASLRSNGVPIDKEKKDRSVDLDCQTKVKLLMDWVNAVCAFYNIKVENFTVSFSDGRVLCYLIHHYHPCYLALDSISQNTTQTVECGQRGTVGLNSSASDSDDSSLDIWTGSTNSTITTPVLFKELLESEKHNFQLVNTAVANLGGVPAMISHLDMSNTIPSEKVVTCYLSFLCARLLDLRKEARAARVIQATWRKYRLKKEFRHYEERTQAACIIQSAAVKFLWRRRQEKKAIAAVIIQVAWRDHVARKKARERALERLYILQNAAATVIQVCWKRYSAMKHFQELRYYTVVLQTRIRTKIALAAYKKILCGVVLIQKRVRACLLARKERKKYLILRTSATVIQRAFRRWKNRTLKRQNSAAAVIQNAFRKWQVQRLARRNEAAVKIQSWYRMYRFQKQYFDVQQKVIKIQAWFKSCLARQLFQKRKEAVLTIQKYLKAYRLGNAERQKYLLVHKAVTVIQSYYRGMKGREFVRQIKAVCLFESLWQMKRERVKFLHKRQSAVILQSHVRRWQAQMSYQKMRKSISLIQACYRAYLIKKKMQNEYNKIRSAATVLQTAYRGMQARKKAHILRSVIKIQAYYRAYAAQKEFRKMKEATIKIQAYVKMVQTRRRYYNLKKAVHDVQRMYRANKLCLLQKLEYRKKREACVCLQAAARGYLKRRQIQTWKMAATKIQSTFRMHKERSRFLEIRNAALVVQKHYRAHKESSICQSTFLTLKAATICLQASYRGFRLRKIIRLQHKSATKIQAAFRAYATRTKFLHTKHASVVIQRQYRAFKAGQNQRMQYVKIKLAAATLQAAYRGHVVRKEVQKQHGAAVAIQAAFRMYRARKHFHALKNAVLVVQQHYKAKLVGGKQREKYLSFCDSVVKLQAAWKGKSVRMEIKKQHTSATIIQSYYKTHVMQTKFKSMRLAALVIQRQYRAYSLGKMQRSQYQQTRKAAVALQAGFRGMRVRRRLQEHHKAACTIQTAFKAFMCNKRLASLKTAAVVFQRRYRALVVGRSLRQQYIELRQAAIKIQAVYRGVKVRKDLQNMHQAATVIQAHFRMHKVRLPYCAMRLAATVIQNQYRACMKGKQEREKYLVIRKSAITIQSAFKGMKVRHQLRTMHKAATLIQARYRKHKRHVHFKRLCWAAAVVQQRYRATKLMKAEVQKYSAMKNAAVCIQSFFRGMKIRKQLKEMKNAAGLIQRRYKAFRDRQQYLSLKAAATVVQQRYRAHILAKLQKEQYCSMRAAAISIQAAYKGMVVRKEIVKRHQAATVIQAAFRMHRVMIPFQAMRLAAVLIQRQYRAYLQGRNERVLFLKYRNSATLIQAAYRGMRLRQQLRDEHSAAAIIQAQFRMYQQNSYYKKLQWATKLVQQKYRACKERDAEVQIYKSKKQAAVVVQAAFHGMKLRKQLKEMKNAAGLIQRRYKAFKARQQYLSLKAAAIVVQQRYRAHIIAKLQKEQYCSMRAAAISIQAAYKGMVVRKEIVKRHQAATVIQAHFRMHKVRLPYCAMRLAATIIQHQYRACMKGKQEREKYLVIRKSVITIQSAFKGMKSRHQLRTRHKAATLIQARYRKHKRHVHSKRLCWAAAVVQQRYRATKLMNAEVQKYSAMKNAAVCIQSFFRGMKIRKQLKEMKNAAGLIQRRYKAFRDRQQYLSLKAAATVVQQRYRAHILAKLQKEQYCSMRAAAISIQAAYKGMVVRKEIVKRHQAATVIQAAFRMHRVMIPFQAMRLAAVLIQRQYRAYLQGRNERVLYLKYRNSATLIQAAYRGMRLRQQLRDEHNAAAIIQAQFRMYQQNSYYKKLQWATKLVQQKYRACKERDAEVQIYKSKKQAAVVVQAAFRGMKSRQHVKDMHKAATTIQRKFKAHSAHKRYVSLKTAAVVIQQKYRALIVERQLRKEYSSLCCAAITIQAVYRGLRTRKHIQQMHHAATTIQAAYRMHRVQLKFQAMRLSAVIIQLHYMSYSRGKKDREKYLQLRYSALTIQSAFRGKKVRQNLAAMHKAATIIQARYRMHRQKTDFKKLSWATKVFQQRYRALRTRDAEVHRYNRIRKAVSCIQAAFRAKRERELTNRKRAAQRVQSFLKMCVQRRQFLQQKAAAVVLQSAFRGYRTRVCYRAMRLSAVVIQRWYRAYKVSQKQKAEYQAIKQAAVTVQSAFRGMTARTLAKQKRAAIKIQSVLHMAVHRRKFIKLWSAAVTLQAHYRAVVTKRKYTSYKTAALTLQKHYRAHQAKKLQRSAYLKTMRSIHLLQATIRGYIARKRIQMLKESAVKIQAMLRGYIARRLAKKMRAAQKIQAWYKGCITHREYRNTQKAIATVRGCVQTRLIRNRFLMICRSVGIIQRRWRETIETRKTHQEFIKIRSAAVKIQAVWRGYSTRKRHDKEQKAACLIQALYRGFVQRKNFQQRQSAALTLQKYVRAWQTGKTERLKFERMKNASVSLQACCRGWLVRKRISEETQAKQRLRFTAAAYHHVCAMKIQRTFRAYLALKHGRQQMHSVICIQRWITSKLQRRKYLKDREKIIKVQRVSRAWLNRRFKAASVIQRAVQKYLCRRRQQRVQHGVVKIQALWRGFCSRKRDAPKVVAIRRRVEKANKESKEENKLGNKTATAIDYLLRYKDLSYIIAALKHLEAATRLSSVCCENLAESGAISTIFILIRSCNRSVPCMEVIAYAIQVLLNLSKYEKTTGAVYEVEHSIDTLLDLLQIYREKAGDKVADKGGSIFTKTCFLLTILLQDERKALDVRKLPKAEDRIRSIYKLTARKHKMDAKLTITRQKMNMSLNGSFFAQATPVKTRLVPKIAPDWVLRKERMREMVDPLRAIQMVVDAFAIYPVTL
ncbi:abnormal spindle-like microcephaly-associated protein homolog isoform X2 [Acipenser ruthenus]|uniref:abnormal spindle-like microcephaly-associated protein homolog isoform X2 n=1 Tax=Acipenser ruthenus TaxID=7906 RepID=UPI0027423CA5|nr:abnormal spindle-like microcephaly-associated protein homolog isoform X2 [Acipenser ruthenus]